VSSIASPGGHRRHGSISVRTADGAESTYCGRVIERPNIQRDWRPPDCKTCLERMKKARRGL